MYPSNSRGAANTWTSTSSPLRVRRRQGELIDQLGVRDKDAGVALRATFIVDPDNTIQHVSVNGLNVGRSPQEILRILDGLQTEKLCPCNRANS